MKKSYKDKRPAELVKPSDNGVPRNIETHLSFTLSTSSEDDELTMSLSQLTVKGRKCNFKDPINKRVREKDVQPLNLKKSVQNFNKKQTNNELRSSIG